jgi:acetoin utilization deacetylase AcuC-like enzyme
MTQHQDTAAQHDARPDEPVTIFYSPAYVDTVETFDTLAKAPLVADLVESDPSVVLREPAPATIAELTEVHDHRYVHAVRTGKPADLAASNGLEWDPKLFDAVAASTGGIRDAALVALTEGVSGSLSTGLHHARTASGRGYATFNGLVVAARAALRAGAARVLILDLDAHAGGGTAELIDGLDGVEQVDVSVHLFDQYTCRLDARLTMTDAADYLSTIESELEQWGNRPTDLVLYNAGMDPHEHAGGLPGITTDVIGRREQMVFEWAASIDAPIAFALAGGYKSRRFTLTDVAGLHRITVDAATGVRRPWSTMEADRSPASAATAATAGGGGG